MRALSAATPHAFNDAEYNLKGVIPDRTVGTVTQHGQRWTVLRPAVQTILVDHIYQKHGQFSDWENRVPYPAYLQQDHP